MMRLPDKGAVRATLLEVMEGSLQAMVAAAEQSRAGAVHAESRAEGSKDMRSTEQSYLARGQAMRAEALGEELSRLQRMERRAYGSDDAVGPDALVGVTIDERDARVFYVVPFGGGTALEVDGIAVTVVTPSSPVGAALMGRRVGDDFERPLRGELAEWVVEAIA